MNALAEQPCQIFFRFDVFVSVFWQLLHHWYSAMPWKIRTLDLTHRSFPSFQITGELELLEEGDYTGEIKEVYDRKRRMVDGREILENPKIKNVRCETNRNQLNQIA